MPICPTCRVEMEDPNGSLCSVKLRRFIIYDTDEYLAIVNRSVLHDFHKFYELNKWLLDQTGHITSEAFSAKLTEMGLPDSMLSLDHEENTEDWHEEAKEQASQDSELPETRPEEREEVGALLSGARKH